MACGREVLQPNQGLYIYIYPYTYIYICAHIPTKTQKPKPLNPLLTSLLLTKHVEEFVSLFLAMSSVTVTRIDLGANTAVTHCNVTPAQLYQ